MTARLTLPNWSLATEGEANTDCQQSYPAMNCTLILQGKSVLIPDYTLLTKCEIRNEHIRLHWNFWVHSRFYTTGDGLWY